MNILQINTLDNRGGAAKIVWSLKKSLEKRGHKTSLFVKHKYSDDKNVFVMRYPNSLTKMLKNITGKDIGSKWIYNKRN